tara:strand:+ start:52 stop:465 length:414 start_codon:yes stop_codon:yes gene_type:complete
MPKVAFVNPDTSFDVQHGTPESGDSDTCEGQGSRSLALESLAANPNAELRVATVFVGGFPIAIQGDYNTEHVHGNQDPEVHGNQEPCDKHSKPLETGSTLVFVSGKGCGRAGDNILDCTFVQTGYETVFVGPPIEEE